MKIVILNSVSDSLILIATANNSKNSFDLSKKLSKIKIIIF